MDSPETYGANNSPRRRDEAKRRRVEATVERLVQRHGLSSETGQALSNGIHGLYRKLVAQRSFDDQDKEYRKLQRCAEQKLAVRTANAFDADGSAYFADAREFAAHMICLESLERRNIGRGKAIEQASKVTWADLSPKQKCKARKYLSRNVLSSDKTRRPAREVGFLRSVAALVKQATGRRVPFSSAPDSQSANRPRHYGVEFDVMTAAAEMANHPLSNEAMARLIQRIRQQ